MKALKDYEWKVFISSNLANSGYYFAAYAGKLCLYSYSLLGHYFTTKSSAKRAWKNFAKINNYNYKFED